MVALPVDAVVDGAAVPTERLEAEACTLAAQLAAATCRFLLIVAELDRREAWRQWGCASACARRASFRFRQGPIGAQPGCRARNTHRIGGRRQLDARLDHADRASGAVCIRPAKGRR